MKAIFNCNKKKRRVLQIIILSLSIVLLLLGVFLGDMEEGIYRKAINICYECIGIG